jgi:hypothetical protein
VIFPEFVLDYQITSLVLIANDRRSQQIDVGAKLTSTGGRATLITDH